MINIIELPPAPRLRSFSSVDRTRRGSYIEVWRSLGGPDPFDLAVPNAISAAQDYVLKGGTPPGSLDFQWWSKRPPGDQEWRGGPGAIDPPDGSLLMESSSGYLPVGQSGTHSTTDVTYTGAFRNSEIKYGIDTSACTFNLGHYLYIEPNTIYGTDNYWEDHWNNPSWNPGQPTPPNHFERQKPATIPAELLGGTLYILSTVYGTTPAVNIYVGDQLSGKYQNNYYGDSVTGSPFYTGDITSATINLTSEFIANSVDALGDLTLSFIDSDTLAGNFACVPGTPTVDAQGDDYLTVDKRAVIDDIVLELDFMSPTYNRFVFILTYPPLRLTQRDDQEGLSPTARLDLSPSNSIQKNNSSRIFGGLYL